MEDRILIRSICHHFREPSLKSFENLHHRWKISSRTFGNQWQICLYSCWNNYFSDTFFLITGGADSGRYFSNMHSGLLSFQRTSEFWLCLDVAMWLAETNPIRASLAASSGLGTWERKTSGDFSKSIVSFLPFLPPSLPSFLPIFTSFIEISCLFLLASEGERNMSPQNKPLWHKDVLELIIFKKEHT